LWPAYADDSTGRKRCKGGAVKKGGCKPRAKRLKPKEIAKLARFAPPDALTYGAHRPLLIVKLSPTLRLKLHVELIAP
jgi:hypothetical protein